MSRMVRSWFNHHLQKGTASWDVVIAKALSITLMSALGCRSGDVAKSRLYTTEVLRYRDIEITIDTADESKEPSLSDLRVMIKLEHCKGSKFEKNTPQVRHLQPLRSHFHYDPIVLLLTHAMRHKFVESASSIQDLLKREAASVDATIKWTQPDAPVLAAFKFDTDLDFTKPANAGQLLRNVKQMGRVAGIRGRVYAHATRLGFAKDMNHIGQPISGATSEAARQSMGHSAKGGLTLTEHYSGEITAPLHNMRLESADPNRIIGREARFTPGDFASLWDSPVTSNKMQAWLDTRNAAGRPFKDKKLVSELIAREKSSIRAEIRDKRHNEASRAGAPEKPKTRRAESKRIALDPIDVNAHTRVVKKTGEGKRKRVTPFSSIGPNNDDAILSSKRPRLFSDEDGVPDTLIDPALRDDYLAMDGDLVDKDNSDALNFLIVASAPDKITSDTNVMSNVQENVDSAGCEFEQAIIVAATNRARDTAGIDIADEDTPLFIEEPDQESFKTAESFIDYFIRINVKKLSRRTLPTIKPNKSRAVEPDGPRSTSPVVQDGPTSTSPVVQDDATPFLYKCEQTEGCEQTFDTLES